MLKTALPFSPPEADLRQNEFTGTSEFTSALPWRSVLRPVIHTGKLHSKMSNGCLMSVGEASINLTADHWVNFSYLENPSFPKCECGGIWRKSVSKDKGVVSLKYRLVLGDNRYGIYWELQPGWWASYADDCFSAEESLLFFISMIF